MTTPPCGPGHYFTGFEKNAPDGEDWKYSEAKLAGRKSLALDAMKAHPALISMVLASAAANY
jgi:hypothetical protein